MLYMFIIEKKMKQFSIYIKFIGFCFHFLDFSKNNTFILGAPIHSILDTKKVPTFNGEKIHYGPKFVSRV